MTVNSIQSTSVKLCIVASVIILYTAMMPNVISSLSFSCFYHLLSPPFGLHPELKLASSSSQEAFQPPLQSSLSLLALASLCGQLPPKSR